MINQLVSFCNQEFTLGNACQSSFCGPPKTCGECLTALHRGNGRDYDCVNMINQYVCQYIYRYSSEIAHLLRESVFLHEFNELNILSIGCGPCPDLFAAHQTFPRKRINYRGYDLNQKWCSIHTQIQSQFTVENNISLSFSNTDVFSDYPTSGFQANVLVLSYVISNIHQHGNVHLFLRKLKDEIVALMPTGSVILINDINLNTMARNYFGEFLGYLNEEGDNFVANRYSFIPGFNYGQRYPQLELIADVPQQIRHKYSTWIESKSAQMAIRKTI